MMSEEPSENLESLETNDTLGDANVRPKRKIKPVENTKDVVKFVDSDDDTSDSEWQENEGSVHGDTENDHGSGGDDSGEGDDESSEGDDEESDKEEPVSEECATDKEEEFADDDEYPEIPPEMVKEDNDDEEKGEPITVTKEDMPFLFEARAPGKRQIKIIQYKNDFIEQAEEMSSETSEDEEWKAKEDDIQDQVLQYEEEDVDMSNIPVENKDSSVEKEKAVTKAEDNDSVLAEVALALQVCGVCLLGSEEDNILECDKCGVTVHEGCYGVQPSDVNDESWFCDPCICSSPEQVYCELCPERTGVMKATDSGKWSHVVCAFYTDGIGFGDTTTLKPIITTDITPSKFGYNKCELCEDKRFAYTGYPINCDAGLCKSFFHVTCAQKCGYLMENLDDEDNNKASPFYAYCKIHVDKDQTRFYKKAYKLFKEHLNAFSKKPISEKILSELKNEHDKYIESRKMTFVPAIMTEKHPRALFGSVSAFSKLIRKAEIYGLDTNVPVIEDETTERVQKIVKPDVSVEFARYYEIKKDNMKQAVARNKQLNVNLHFNRTRERELQDEITFLQNELPKMSKKYEKLRFQAEAIWKFLNKIDPENYSVPECLLEKPKIKIKANLIQQKIGLKNCIMCNSYEQPDSMVDCDGCQYWYHFHCLDPPVTRNPKVSKAYAWFCSACSNGPEKLEDPLEALSKTKKKAKTATKFGRAVKKPDHFKPENSSDLKAPPPPPQAEDIESESVVSFESNTFKTFCENCEESDNTQKLHCNNCKNHFHLHCTAGSYENKIFLCDKCDESNRLEKAAAKASMKPQIELLDSCSTSNKRKNIFELQYNLMQKRQKQGSQSEDEVCEDTETEECISEANRVSKPDTDDELNEIIKEDMFADSKPHIIHQEITDFQPTSTIVDIKSQIIHQQLTGSDTHDDSIMAGDVCSSVITTVVPENSQQITLEIATTSAAESASMDTIKTEEN